MPTFIQEGFKKTRTRHFGSKRHKTRQHRARRKNKKLSTFLDRQNEAIIKTTGTIATAGVILGAANLLKR